MSLINDALKRANEAQKKRSTTGPLGAPLQPADLPPRRAPARSNWAPVMIPIIVVVLLALAFWLIRSGFSGKAPAPVEVAVTTPVPPPPVIAKPLPPVQRTPEPVPAPKPFVSKSGIVVDTNIVVHEIPVEKPVSLVETTVPVPVPEPVVEKKTPVEDSKPVAVEAKSRPKTLAEAREAAAAKTSEPIKEEAKTTPAPVPKPAPAPAPAKPAFPELKLQGIFYRLNNPTALVSGKIVKPGDSIRGAKVVSIERSSLVLEFGGERKTLEISVQ